MTERTRLAKHYLKILSLPLFFLVLFASLNFAWQIFNIPPAEELALMLRAWFDAYGLPILFLSSIVEGALLVGNYFPGVFVIFLGVILADSVGQAVTAVSVISVGLMIAHIFNYVLGRYGWHTILIKFGLKQAIDGAKEKLQKRGPTAILLSYWMPSLGAITDTAAGIIRLPFRIFLTYAIISTIMWNTIAGTTVYVVGDKALALASPSSTRSIIFYVILAIWVMSILLLDHLNRKQKVPSL
jgi:membrane protein DedA with SNARE-associated domain